MPLRPRPRVLLALLTAAVLLALAVPSVDAYMPRARPYHAGGAITLDTNLLSKSGASAWAIDQYLKSTTSLPALGAAFLTAEKKYGVNARFLVAAAMHESAWGTSYIARVKHNLFGYNAYDRDPFRYASAYATYAANINATAKFIRDFYLTPGGRWWGGAPTLRSMQQFWSGSHTWGVNVSRIANSIHLATFRGRSLKFRAPAVKGRLHGGDAASVTLAWAGGGVPAKAEFVATWVPVALDSDAVSAVAAGLPAAGGAAVALPTAPLTPASSLHSAPAVHLPTTTAARRAKTGARSVTLSVKAPRQAGSYLLEVTMRDAGGRALPKAERVTIPAVEVRVWGDHAVSFEFQPMPDGGGAVVRVTNTGRTTIPAVVTEDQPVSAKPGVTVHTVVTVTASSTIPADPAPVVLLSVPLASSLKPGASVTLALPAIAASTGRTGNWLSASLTIPGSPDWLAAYSPVGAWLSAAGISASAPSDASPALFDGPTTGSVSSTLLAAPAASPSPTPSPTPIASPAPTATPSTKPSTATKTSTATKHVTRWYSEHSSAMRYRGSWGNAPYPGYLGGNVTWSTTVGSTASFTFTGSRVSWIGPLGPTRGKALVILDGRAVATVNLWRSSFIARAVLFSRSFKTSGRHTLTIKVLSAPGRQYVAIDAFVIRT